MSTVNFRTSALNTTTTTNGDLAFKSSNSTLVDFLYKVPVAENATDVELLTLRLMEDVNYSDSIKLKAILYLRDIREGMGIRDNFRIALRTVANFYYLSPDRISTFIEYIPVVGRWDDLVCDEEGHVSCLLQDHNTSTKVTKLIKAGMSNENTFALCAKWMPRKGVVAKLLAKRLFPFSKTPHKDYRKTIAKLSNTLEQKMSANRWEDIEFSKLPSLALSKHKRAFVRNCPNSWAAFNTKVSSGEAKVNAGAIYPHQIWSAFNKDANQVIANSQWNSIPIKDFKSKILVMADTSGSMWHSTKYGYAIDICVSLSVFLAEKLPWPFKDLVLNFSANPEFVDLSAQTSSMDKIKALHHAAWAMNTDFRKAYQRILEIAKANSLPQAEMPEYLLVFSDMQFDVSGTGKFPVASIRESFESFGYRMPKLIFWNLVDSDTMPAENEDGVLLLSGFSIKLLEQILASSGDFTPESAILNLLKDKYEDLD